MNHSARWMVACSLLFTVSSMGGPARAQGDAVPPPAQVPPTAPLAKLTGSAAWAALVGNTIAGKAGTETFAEFFDPGGGVKRVDENGPSSGTWAVQDEKVCFDFPDDDDRSCLTFTVTGGSGTAVDDDGSPARFDILPGNSKGL